MNYRALLELSARAEEKWLATEQERYYVMARRYLDLAIQASR
jgi:hypothetical protein